MQLYNVHFFGKHITDFGLDRNMCVNRNVLDSQSVKENVVFELVTFCKGFCRLADVMLPSMAACEDWVTTFWEPIMAEVFVTVFRTPPKLFALLLEKGPFIST